MWRGRRALAPAHVQAPAQRVHHLGRIALATALNHRPLPPASGVTRRVSLPNQRFTAPLLTSRRMPAVGGLLHRVFDDVDAAEIAAEVAACELVKVARHGDHVCAFAGFAQRLLQDVVAGLRPVPLPSQLPAVDGVAHQQQRLARDRAQEVRQRYRLAARRAQAQVGEPRRTQAQPVRVPRLVGRHRGRRRHGIRLSCLEGVREGVASPVEHHVHWPPGTRA